MKARIVYMGTPEFAVAPLQALHNSEHDVVGVVTVPDRQAGRGRKPTPSAVKVAAEEMGLPILQPEKLRDEKFQAQLKELNADIFVVVAFRMLPESVWRIPSKGTFNLHASLLPDYRGAAPIHWAVINGEAKSGVTTFMIDEEIDTGNILLQAETEIGPNETTGQLYQRLMDLGSPLVVETVDGLMADAITGKPQKHVVSPKEAPKLFREHQYVHVNQSARVVHNCIRGLSPFPAPLLKVAMGTEQFDVKVASSLPADEKIGEVGQLEWTDDALKIQCSEGVILIREIQWPGKRKMSVKDFKNGFSDYPSIEVVVNP